MYVIFIKSLFKPVLYWLLILMFISLQTLMAGESKEEENKTEKNSFVIIVHPEVQLERVDPRELSIIYLGKKTLWEDGTRIQPSMLKENKKIMKKFIGDVLNKSVYQYRAYWKRKLFSGGGTVPKTFKKPNDIIEYVSKRPGAIGVIPTGITIDNKVKILEMLK